MPWCCGWPPGGMGAALSSPQEGGVVAAVTSQPQPTMADVIRERKKKAGGASLGTLRRRLAARADRQKADRGCEHARYIRQLVGSWRLPEVFALCSELEALVALRDLTVQAELAREPAAPLHVALHKAYTQRWWCDVQLVGAGYVISAHRAILCARCVYFRDLFGRHPSNAWLVPIDGAGGALSRDEMEAVVKAMYGIWHDRDYEDGNTEDVVADVNQRGRDTTLGCRCTSVCDTRGRSSAAALRRLGSLLGFTMGDMARDMKYLLDSGEYADCRLVFRLEGAQYGFRTALELPCHRAVLGARSRYFRTMMTLGGVSGTLCVDDTVLPRRLARALLHAAYTDQVDLSLISRNVSPTSSTNSSTSSQTGWSNMAAARAAMASKTSSVTRHNNAISRLDDAFALLEVARFLEMPIVVQGCEDAIAGMLAPRTLPHILRRADHPIATPWLMRQAMRYLMDEFPACLSDAGAVELPRTAVAEALSSSYLQCSESQALRALVRWAERVAANRPCEPNVVWHTAHSVTRKTAKRREVTDSQLKQILTPLLGLLRLDAHATLQPDMQQLVRRGIVPPCSLPSTDDLSSDSWLPPTAAVTPRCFVPYLDELRALLEGQTVDRAQVERIVRERYMQPIPDTLYMVAATRPAAPPDPPAACEAACVPPAVLATLRARVRELHAHTRPMRHHADKARMQLALRAVREVSLPDSCAELLLQDDHNNDRDSDVWEPDDAERRGQASNAPDCCSRPLSSSSGGVVGGGGGGGSSGSLRASSSHLPGGSNPSTLRRGSPSNLTPLGRLPDIALPDANAHLLTARDYYTAAVKEYGTVLQLDLGDGATHTPRPGSRAQRAAAAAAAADRLQQRRGDGMQGLSSRPRHSEDELRAAIEMSVIRAYGMHPAGAAGASGSLPAPSPSPAAPLPPPCYRNNAQASTSNTNTPRPSSRTPPTASRRPLSASPSPGPRGTLTPSRGHLERGGGTLNRCGGTLDRCGGTLDRSGGHIERNGGTLNRSGGNISRGGTLDRGDRTMNRENNHNSQIERSSVYCEAEREYSPIVQERQSNVRVERGGININTTHIGEARILSDFNIPLDLGSGNFYNAEDPTENLSRLNLNLNRDEIGSNFMSQADTNASNPIAIPNVVQHHTNERMSNSLNTESENLPNILRNQEMISNSLNMALENTFIPIPNERFLHLDSSIPNIHSRLQERYSERGGTFSERGRTLSERGGTFSERGGTFSERGGANLSIADLGGTISTVHTPQRGLTLGNEKSRTGKVRSSKNSSRVNAPNFGSLNSGRNSIGASTGEKSRGQNVIAPQGVTAHPGGVAAHHGGASAPSARCEPEGTPATRSTTGGGPSPGLHRVGSAPSPALHRAGSSHALQMPTPSPRRVTNGEYRLESRNSYTSSASTSRNVTPDPHHDNYA